MTSDTTLHGSGANMPCEPQSLPSLDKYKMILDEHNQTIRSMVSMVRGIADKAFGEEPMTESGAEKLGRSGLIGQLDSMFLDQGEALADLRSQLTRLDELI